MIKDLILQNLLEQDDPFYYLLDLKDYISELSTQYQLPKPYKFKTTYIFKQRVIDHSYLFEKDTLFTITDREYDRIRILTNKGYNWLSIHNLEYVEVFNGYTVRGNQ